MTGDAGSAADADRTAKAAEAVQSLSRSELRSWAKVHPEMGINGNSSSMAIRAAMLKAIRGSKAGGDTSDRLHKEVNQTTPGSKHAGAGGGTEKKDHTEDEAVTAAAAAAAASAQTETVAITTSGRVSNDAKESTQASRGAASGLTSRFGWNREVSGRLPSTSLTSMPSRHRRQSKIPVGRWR